MSHTYGSVPQPDEGHLRTGYGGSSYAAGNPSDSSPLAQSLGQQSRFDDSQRSGSAAAASSGTTAVNNSTPSRGGTLKKKASVKRTGSLKRSSSRKSLKAGSIKGYGDDKEDFNSAFWTPIPTSGTPTDVLADRFQAWRQLLKSLIAYFREVQASYESRSKALHKLHSTVSNIAYPTDFITNSGLGEATYMLDDYHKRSVAEANKSREIEEDVIGALTGLRSDLGQKIKEIKHLGGDFKNSVDKEQDLTRREVEKLQAALENADLNGSADKGKNDPFVVRLGVDRSIEKQIDEENYLHRAYLNLESSGRELESIVVGEIQKAYKALAGILRREGDDAYNVVESLRAGPISMPKDQEWSHFVSNDPHLVSRDIPLRRIEDIAYPGKDNPAAAEIRAGMLERKSKYLKSYSAGWYVLSPTHLHEFKSADKIYTQPPVMSLYLGDQRLGSHSELGSSSHKFMLKGRQAGSGHKGHNWVFRAESYDTMLAWFNDIKTLTEGTAGERSAFMRKHTRSVSNSSDRPRSFSSDGFDDDDADAVPYSADAASLAEQHPIEPKPQRPVPGGRFPSDLQVPRSMQRSAPSDDSDIPVAAAVTSPVEEYGRRGTNPYQLEGVDAGKNIPYADRKASEPVAAPIVSRQVYVPTTPPAGSPSATIASIQHPVQAYEPTRPIQQKPTIEAVLQQPVAPPTSVEAASQQSASPAAQIPQQTAHKDKVVEDLAAPVAAGAALGAGYVGAEAYESRKDNAKELDKSTAMEEGHAESTLTKDDTNKVLLDPVPTRRTTELAAEPASLGAASEDVTVPSTPMAELPVATTPLASSVPVIADLTTPIRPTASIVATPDAPATRAASTTAVKNAELVTDSSADSSAAPVSTSIASDAKTDSSSTPVSASADIGAIPASTKAESSSTPMSTESSISSMPAPTGTTSTSKAAGSSTLGGLEREGAHYTGKMPTVVRHDTDISVSKLHVPGEFR